MRLRTRLVFAFLLASGTLGIALPAFSQTYDVVLRNGRVMDPETKLNAIRNVGIQDGKIAAITADALSGKTIIDATGLVVAPGFIDLHSHGQDAENCRYKAMAGVTTALELERGGFPVAPWYTDRAGKALINYGASSGHIPVVMNVLHDTGTFLPRDPAVIDAPRPALQAGVFIELEQGLREGGIGIGMGLAYTPTQSPAAILRVFEL